VVIIDRPGAEQSVIVGGCASLDRGDPDYEAFQTVNTAFGGQFSSRINMNLREDKGYTYGARSQLAAFRAGGLFLITAPVHTEHTAASLAELLAELEGIRGARPLTAAERDDSCNRRTMGFPQRFETWRGTAGQLETLVLNDLPLDSWAAFIPAVADLTADDLAACARRHLEPTRLTWIVVGDRAAIEADLRALGLGEVEVIPAGS
jgi:zinc protease